MQSETPVQLTVVPPKPMCNPASIFTGTDCQDRINLYNQAVEQRRQQELHLYVNRQKELASAPLQQQIASLNKLTADQQAQIKNLQSQIQTQTVASIAARNQGLQQGVGICVGATLVLVAMIFGIRRLMKNFTVTKKPQAHSASA
jgi:hypothetical protein